MRSAVIVLLGCVPAGCSEGGETASPIDAAPVILTFTSDSTSANVGEALSFQLEATDDVGLDSAIVSYGDSSRTFLPVHGRKRLSATVSRYYAAPGTYKAIFTVYDTRVQSSSTFLMININLF